MRLDVYLAEKLAVTRTRASNIIKMGGVTVDGRVINKPGEDISEDKEIIVSDTVKYASLGGVKLERALEEFSLSLDGAECLDIGASNGGFTHCMIAHGAKKVTAVDLHLAFPEELADDSRVEMCDEMNVKSLVDEFQGRTFDFITVDLSFISLEPLFPLFYELLREGSRLLVLFKPQFEVGRKALPKSGVVRDKKAIEKAYLSVLNAAKQTGFTCVGYCPVPEYFSDKNEERTVLFYK